MKKILKVLLIIIIVIYVAIVGFLTVCLLNLNDFNVTEFSNSSLIIVEDEELKPDYEKGSLVVVKHSNNDIKVGDKIFFYNTYANQVNVNYAEVIKVEKIDEKEQTYTLTGDYPLSSEYVIGKSSTSTEYKGIGSILKALESKWGYLFCVIVPILFAFVYEVYVVIKEIKNTKPSKKNKKVVVKENNESEEL